MADISCLSNFKESIYAYNTNRSRKKNQDWRKKDCWPLSSDPLRELSSLPELYRKILNYLIWLDNNYPFLYVSQQTIADHCNVTRETVNRIIGKLIRYGYVISNYNHMTSCEYKITKFLKLIPIRQVLSFTLTALKYVSMSVLTTTLLHMATIPNSEITQVKSYLDYYIYLAKRNSHKLHNQHTCKRIADHNRLSWCNDKQKNIKGSTIMHQLPAFEDIDYSALTEIGQARLLPYPEAALTWAVSRIRKHSGIKNPFVYFQKLCKIYCQEHGIEPDWSLSHSVISKQKLDPNGPTTTGNFIKPALLKQTSSTVFPKKGREKVKNQQQATDDYRAKRKAWIATLPPADEKTLRSMAQFFPGTPEELEAIIKKNNEDRLAWIAKNQALEQTATPVVVKPPEHSYTGAKSQPADFMDELPLEYSQNYNDDSIYEEIIEEPIW